MTDEDVPFVGEPPEEPPELPTAAPVPESTPPVELEPPPLAPAEADSGTDSDSDTPSEPTFLGKSWPLFAAALLIAGPLVAVFSLLSPRPAGASAAAAAAAAGTPAFVTLDAIELRPEPSATAGSLATLEEGDRVEAFGTRGTWLEVESDGKRGYLPVDVVERESDRVARKRREKTLLAFAPVYGVVGDATDVILAPYPLAPRAGRLA